MSQHVNENGQNLVGNGSEAKIWGAQRAMVFHPKTEVLVVLEDDLPRSRGFGGCSRMINGSKVNP